MVDQRPPLRSVGICVITGNVCGTDTWPAGQPCLCRNCQAYLYTMHVEAEHERLREENAHLKEDLKLLREENTRLCEELDHADYVADQRVKNIAHDHAAAVANLNEARAEVEQLRDALRPFAFCVGDDGVTRGSFLDEDCRRARSLLEEGLNELGVK